VDTAPAERVPRGKSYSRDSTAVLVVVLAFGCAFGTIFSVSGHCALEMEYEYSSSEKSMLQREDRPRHVPHTDVQLCSV